MANFKTLPILSNRVPIARIERKNRKINEQRNLNTQGGHSPGNQ